EFIQIFRDPRSLGLAISIPMLLLLLFGYALTLDVDRIPTVLLDLDRTPRSRAMSDQFFSSRYFILQEAVDSYSRVQAMIDRGEAMMGLVIPAAFSRDIQAGRQTQIQVLMDGTDANTATIALGYAQTIVALYSQELFTEKLTQLGMARISPPVEPRIRVWFNADLESRNFIVPGLIAVIMVILAAILTSGTVAREWERGTMEQLISTPMRKSELIFGKLIPYLAIGMFDIAIAVAMGIFLFEVPLRGSGLLLFSLAGLFLLGAIGQGVVVSVLAKNQLLSSQISIFISYLPTFILSGFIYPIHNMPQVIQFITYIFPSRYVVSILKGIFSRGAGLEILWVEALLLAIYASTMIFFAMRKFQKRIL
ncbi:MAG TPA: ABC transporter permease, partial [Thermodesulfobacteriota bacterium]|nr:ABC transporter permease [Thermodesulfobacteriota bacterium]